MPTSMISLTASAANLRRLAVIRLILIIGLASALAYTWVVTQSDLVHPTLLTILALFALVNMLTFWRLQQPWPVTDAEYFGQLLFDICSLTVVLYTSGGATNPFVSYYLVPITISAALLPWHYTWVISGLSLAAYTLMLFFYQPLPAFQPHQSAYGGHHSGPSLHILGMWFTFALSTTLITYFVVKMANALRQQQQLRARGREDELRDEQILAVATLAAGTAHQLGTPLATMLVLLEELSDSYRDNEPLSQDLQILGDKVESCRKILSELVSTAEIHSHHEKRRVRLGKYIATLVDHWQVLRPRDAIEVAIEPQTELCELWVDPTLEQAIANLLNNAADANRSGTETTAAVELALRCEDREAVIDVGDRGPGIPLEIAEQIGRPFISTKGKGLGLGLFLSHATIDRYGGSITLYNRPGGGTMAELRLPLLAGRDNDGVAADD